ncbi:MAG: hypothetical protein GX213_11670 [Clostridiaceae bacterium]|nr:hypothetical protein [Clostridiaceae bacterium]
MSIKNMKICLMDSNKEVVSVKRLIDLPIKEEGIISKSIEWYNDPEPCTIHRSAVMKRIYFELMEYLEMNKQNGINLLPLESIPYSLLSLFDIEGEVSFFTI